MCSNDLTHQITERLKANDSFESDAIWHCPGQSLYMDGGLTLTFLMWFLHSTREAQPSPEGCYVTGEFSQWAFGFKKINWSGWSSKKSGRKWWGLLPLAFFYVNSAHLFMNHIKVVLAITLVLDRTEEGIWETDPEHLGWKLSACTYHYKWQYWFLIGTIGGFSTSCEQVNHQRWTAWPVVYVHSGCYGHLSYRE